MVAVAARFGGHDRSVQGLFFMELRLPAVLSGADEVTVAFDPAYLLDAPASFEAPGLLLEPLGTGRRALLAAADSPEVHRHLLMSVKQLVRPAPSATRRAIVSGLL